jgi:hypothetical protein
VTSAQGYDPLEVVPDSEPGAELDEVVVTVEFRGQRFAIRPEGVSFMALMEFAVVAKQQRTGAKAVGEMDQIVAIRNLLRSCIVPDEWDAFVDHAIEVNAGADELMGVLQQTIEAHAERPTQPSSSSPGGPQPTGTSSAGGSSSPDSSTPVGSIDVQHELEAQGRPDLALVVKNARQATSGRS